MATSTFERKIELNSPEAVVRLAKIMSDETPRKPLTVRSFSQEERDRSEQLLRKCKLRSTN